MIKLRGVPIIGRVAIATIVAARNVRSRLAYRYSIVMALDTGTAGRAVVHFHGLSPTFGGMAARAVVGR